MKLKNENIETKSEEEQENTDEKKLFLLKKEKIKN